MFFKNAHFYKNLKGTLLTKTLTYTHHLLSIIQRGVPPQDANSSQTGHLYFCSFPSYLQWLVRNASVVENSEISCHANWDANTVIWSLPPGVLVAPAAPSVVSGWWVLSCPGFSAVCRVPSWDQWVLPQGEERCWGRYYSVLSCWVSLCFPLPSSTSFLEIVTPNGSDVGHLLWLFPFFFLLFFNLLCLSPQGGEEMHFLFGRQIERW